MKRHQIAHSFNYLLSFTVIWRRTRSTRRQFLASIHHRVVCAIAAVSRSHHSASAQRRAFDPVEVGDRVRRDLMMVLRRVVRP